MNASLYPIGISTNPTQVVIGKSDWLYLGDRHEKTITVTRRGATLKDAETAAKIGLATKSWEQWLKARGVRLYLLMLCPNKDTIYPEHTPDWMKTVTNSVTNTLLANVSQNIYIDPRANLLAAKSQFSEPLYYKTDTHWNDLGAWVAFRALIMETVRTETELRWLSEQDVHVSKITNRHGGDLANFLRMTDLLLDSELAIKIDSEVPIETKLYDFGTGRLIGSDSNTHIVTPLVSVRPAPSGIAP